MKKLFLIMIIGFVWSINNLWAQDIIVMKNGEDIFSEVVEINQTEVKYRRFDNLSGPLYTITKNEIFVIKYQDGTREVITAMHPAKQEGKNQITTTLSNSLQSKLTTEKTIGEEVELGIEKSLRSSMYQFRTQYMLGYDKMYDGEYSLDGTSIEAQLKFGLFFSPYGIRGMGAGLGLKSVAYNDSYSSSNIRLYNIIYDLTWILDSGDRKDKNSFYELGLGYLIPIYASYDGTNITESFDFTVRYTGSFGKKLNNGDIVLCTIALYTWSQLTHDANQYNISLGWIF